MIEILLVLAFISECPFLEIASRVKGHQSKCGRVHDRDMTPSTNSGGFISTLDFKTNCEKWKCKCKYVASIVFSARHLPVRAFVRAGPRRPLEHGRWWSQSTCGLLAFGIEPKPFRSVKQKHIKPCDSSLKSVKACRVLDEGILFCSMNREMEKKISPQGGRLCIFWSYFRYISTFVQCTFNARFFH